MNNNQIRSQQGDTISSIAYRYYGSSKGQVERILAVNPRLCQYPALLPPNIFITLPAKQQTATRAQTVNLWD